MTTTTGIARKVWRETLDPDAAHLARRALLDSCAAMLAGLHSDQARAVREMGAASGAAGPQARALMWGTAGHALDFDDYEDVGSTHPSVPILAALFGVLPGRTPTLGEVLRAYVAGYETILTIGYALTHAHYLRGWHATGTLGALGAAVAVARLLDLPPDRGGAALSIAMTRAGGLKRQFGSEVKALHAGLAAETGVLAALLAAAGMQAEPDLLTGPTGFLSLMGGATQDWPDVPTQTICRHPPYAKPWPSCGYTHRAIEAALELSARLGPDGASGILSARLTMPDAYFGVAGFRAPETEAQARFSASYCVAAGLVRGAITPRDFEPQALADPAVRALEALISPQLYPLPAGAGDMSPLAPDSLHLTLADGQTLSASVSDVRGGPAKVLSNAELSAKFIACGGLPEEARAFWEADASAPFTLFAGLRP